MYLIVTTFESLNFRWKQAGKQEKEKANDQELHSRFESLFPEINCQIAK